MFIFPSIFAHRTSSFLLMSCLDASSNTPPNSNGYQTYTPKNPSEDQGVPTMQSEERRRHTKTQRTSMRGNHIDGNHDDLPLNACKTHWQFSRCRFQLSLRSCAMSHQTRPMTSTVHAVPSLCGHSQFSWCRIQTVCMSCALCHWFRPRNSTSRHWPTPCGHLQSSRRRIQISLRRCALCH